MIICVDCANKIMANTSIRMVNINLIAPCQFCKTLPTIEVVVTHYLRAINKITTPTHTIIVLDDIAIGSE